MEWCLLVTALHALMFVETFLAVGGSLVSVESRLVLDRTILLLLFSGSAAPRPLSSPLMSALYSSLLRSLLSPVTAGGAHPLLSLMVRVFADGFDDGRRRSEWSIVNTCRTGR